MEWWGVTWDSHLPMACGDANMGRWHFIGDLWEKTYIKSATEFVAGEQVKEHLGVWI